MAETTRLIRTEFATVNLNPDQLGATDELRRSYSSLLDAIERLAPPGRARVLAITKLQESCMWSVRGVAEGEIKTGAPR